jgi:hypothetical protein
MSAATPGEVRIMLHMLGSSHPRSPLGWRNYGAWNRDDEQMLRMIDKGLVCKGSERGGYIYTHVSPEWVEALGATRA